MAYFQRPQSEALQVFNYIDNPPLDISSPPVGLNYITSIDRRLQPQKFFRFGELQKIIFWENSLALGNGYHAYSVPVVEERFTYNRDPVSRIPYDRTQEIQWYREDGSLHPFIKQREKVYDGISAMQELVRRRVNNVDLINYSLIGMVMLTDPVNYPTSDLVIADGQAFYVQDAVESARNNYEKDGNDGLISHVQSDVSYLPWADTDIAGVDFAAAGMPVPDIITDNPNGATVITIRDHIVYELSMGAIAPS